jgi:hypothetical protein
MISRSPQPFCKRTLSLPTALHDKISACSRKGNSGNVGNLLLQALEIRDSHMLLQEQHAALEDAASLQIQTLEEQLYQAGSIAQTLRYNLVGAEIKWRSRLFMSSCIRSWLEQAISERRMHSLRLRMAESTLRWKNRLLGHSCFRAWSEYVAMDTSRQDQQEDQQRHGLLNVQVVEDAKTLRQDVSLGRTIESPLRATEVKVPKTQKTPPARIDGIGGAVTHVTSAATNRDVGEPLVDDDSSPKSQSGLSPKALQGNLSPKASQARHCPQQVPQVIVLTTEDACKVGSKSPPAGPPRQQWSQAWTAQQTQRASLWTKPQQIDAMSAKCIQSQFVSGSVQTQIHASTRMSIASDGLRAC